MATTAPVIGGRPRGRVADELRLQLADDIVRGLLTPGTGLDETELARRFRGVAHAGREAIRGSLPPADWSRCAPIAARWWRGRARSAWIGMFEAMAELEALCAGLAAERMTPGERDVLEAGARGAARAHSRRRSAALSRGQRGVPRRDLCRRAQWLCCRSTHATRARVQPFRRAQFRNLGRLAKSHVEHDRVVLAILRGDRAGAAGAMREHIMTVCEEYEAYAELLEGKKG